MDATYDGDVRRDAEDVTLHLLRIYTRRPIRINCAARRRKYAPKDIEARYYDANERSKRGGIHIVGAADDGEIRASHEI